MNHLTCKIHWTYSTDQESFDPELWKEWEEKQKIILSDSVHPVRLQNSVLARMSLEKLKGLHGKVFNPSFSHTNGIGLCSVTENLNEYSGIDIEKADRDVREDAIKMFKNDKDEDLPLLQLWCVKEAAFKALSNSFDRTEPELIKDIVIKKQEFQYKQVIGEWKTNEFNIDGCDYLLALSSLRK